MLVWGLSQSLTSEARLTHAEWVGVVRPEARLTHAEWVGVVRLLVAPRCPHSSLVSVIVSWTAFRANTKNQARCLLAICLFYPSLLFSLTCVSNIFAACLTAVNRHRNHSNSNKGRRLIGSGLQFERFSQLESWWVGSMAVLRLTWCWRRSWEFDILILRKQEETVLHAVYSLSK